VSLHSDWEKLSPEEQRKIVRDSMNNAEADIQPVLIEPGKEMTLSYVWTREEPFWPKELRLFGGGVPGDEYGGISDLDMVKELRVLSYKVGRYTIVASPKPTSTWRLGMFEGDVRQYCVVRQSENISLVVRNGSDKPVKVGMKFLGVSGVDIFGTADAAPGEEGVEFEMRSGGEDVSYHPFDVLRRLISTGEAMWEGFKNGRAKAERGQEPPEQIDHLFALPVDEEPVPAGIFNNGRALIVEGIDVFRLGVEIIRERLDPPAPPSDDTRTYAAGFFTAVLDKEGRPTDKTVMEAGERMMLYATPQIFFRPERFSFEAMFQSTNSVPGEQFEVAGFRASEDALRQLKIVDIKVGHNSQFPSSQALEARFFGPNNDRHLKLDVCQPQVNIRVEVMNAGPRPVSLVGLVEGRAVIGD
jgi:hypothetical protein